jgi:steroid 5-alpha reductase family enzyme
MTTFTTAPATAFSGTDTSTDAALRRQARKRVEAKMGFAVHLLVYVCVNAGLFAISTWFGGGRWSALPLLGWGLGLAIHGVVTVATLQGQSLRERWMAAELQQLRERAAR